MRVVVFGGRDFTDERFGFRALDLINERFGPITVVIDGMAKGADTIGFKWASANGIQTERYRAQWDKYGRAAGPIRNEQMVKEGKPDFGVAFPGSTGTRHMKREMERNGLKVHNINKGVAV